MSTRDSDEGHPAFDGLCTVTMQGGGVFGFSLLGQLQAVEKLEHLRPIAYAGASAGGLMATLRWAGLKPEEIRDELKSLVGNRQRLGELLGASANGDKHQWSADPRIVAKLRNSFLRLWGLTKLPSNMFLRWYSRIRDLLFILAHAHVGLRAWRYGGLFSAGGFVTWLDDILRKRLKAELEAAKERLCNETDDQASTNFARWLDEIGIPPLDSTDFTKHRPRFVDFDLARYILPSERTSPILILSVTSVTRREPLFIDSYSAAFEHIPIADAVRATIAFPFVFQPTPLGIVRENRNDGSSSLIKSSQRLATRQSLSNKERSQKLSISSEAFIDGGVMANFPIWAVARYLRQTLYGHTPERLYETIRLRDASDATSLLRERFTKDGTSIVAPPSNMADDVDLDIPLRALAFRPMLHLGLRLVEPVSPAVDKGGLGFRIGALLTTGARSFHENMALAEGGRMILTEQLSDATGWTDRLLDFDKLTADNIDAMFDRGWHYAMRRLSDIELEMSPLAARRSGGDTTETIQGILHDAAAGTLTVLAEALSKRKADALVTGVDASLCMLDGNLLKEAGYIALPADDSIGRERQFHVVGAEINAPELYCYHERCAVMAFPAERAWWWELGDAENRPAVRIVFPVTDFTYGNRTPIATWFAPGIEKINESMYALTGRMNAVLFGTVTVNIYASALDGADASLWNGIIEAARDKDQVLFAGLRMLQVHADRLSALLTDTLSYASSELSPERPKRRGPVSTEDRDRFSRLVGLSPREAEMLDRFYEI